MNSELIIFLILLVVGISFWLYKRNKNKPEKKETYFIQYQNKVANLVASGKVENKDYVVAIISMEEFNSKTKEEIDNWIKGKVDKEGTLSTYTVTGLGLKELTYTDVEGKEYDVFFLIVDKTSQEVIDWKANNIQVVEFPNDDIDRTREVREILNNAEDGSTIHFLNDTIVVNGMLPEDFEKYRYGDVGEAGILRIENKKKLTIESKAPSGKTIFKKTEEIKTTPDRDNNLASVLSHLKLVDCENIKCKDLIFEGVNNVEGTKPGLPIYDSKRYSEHGFDISRCKNITFENCGAQYVFGDGFYLRQGILSPNILIPNENIKIIDCNVYWNGRQGIGIVHADGVFIQGGNITSRRSGIDFEPNAEKYTVKNVVIRDMAIRSQLLPFPMGGKGRVQNILIENNTYHTGSPVSKILGKADVEGSRRNIWFRNNRSIASFGSPSAAFVIENAENILIEDEMSALTKNRSGKMFYLLNSRNIVVRNSEFPNAKFIVMLDTPTDEVKVYNNSPKLQFQMLRDPSDYRSEFPLGDVVDIEEYDVERLGEPDLSWTEELITNN